MAVVIAKHPCGVEFLERLIMEKIPARFRDINLKALRLGASGAAA